MKTILSTILLVLINLFAFATLEKKTVSVRVDAPGGNADETTIYFDLGVTPVYTSTEDAPKVFSTIPTAPSIYSLSSDNVFCSTNGYSDLNASEIIPLGLRTDTAGTYVFTASVLTNFDVTSIIRLEDRQENVFTDLRTHLYSVQLPTGISPNGRFFLHVSRAISFTSVAAGCSNDNGALQITADNAVTWATSYLYDSLNNLAGSWNNVSGSYTFLNLREGNYHLIMTYGNYSVNKTFAISSNYAVVHIQSPTGTVSVNQEIIFHTAIHNVTSYQWDMGDGAQIAGTANPSYSYILPGVYTVQLTGSNSAGCQFTDSVTMTVSSATGVNEVTGQSRTVTAYAKTVTVVLNEEIKQGAELKIYNLLSQPVYDSPVNELTSLVTLSEQPTGYYIVSLQNNKILSTKRVFIGK